MPYYVYILANNYNSTVYTGVTNVLFGVFMSIRHILFYHLLLQSITLKSWCIMRSTAILSLRLREKNK